MSRSLPQSTSKSLSKTALMALSVACATVAMGACSSESSSTDTASDATSNSSGSDISSPPTSIDMDYVPESMVQMFSENQLFSTFAELVALTDLAPLFEADGEITVFLPANHAFDKLPAGTLEKLKDPRNREALTRLLSYHMMDGKVSEMEITSGTLTMKSGDTVTVEVGPEVGYLMNMKIAGVTVVVGDIFAGKSVAHMIGDVMVPPDLDLSAL